MMPPVPPNQNFSSGVRVRLSQQGKASGLLPRRRLANGGDVFGTVLYKRLPRGGTSVPVLWDGTNVRQRFHYSFLEKL